MKYALAGSSSDNTTFLTNVTLVLFYLCNAYLATYLTLRPKYNRAVLYNLTTLLSIYLYVIFFLVSNYSFSFYTQYYASSEYSNTSSFNMKISKNVSLLNYPNYLVTISDIYTRLVNYPLLLLAIRAYTL